MGTQDAATAILGDPEAVRAWQEPFYKNLHEHPELSHQEVNTAASVADRLRGAGYDVTEKVGGTGVVGVLRNGDGPSVLLRSELDALPVKEATGLPYASTVTATDAQGTVVPVAHAVDTTSMSPACWEPRNCSPIIETSGLEPASPCSSPRRRSETVPGAW